MKSLTAERARELLDYDAKSGIFRWKVATSNRVRVGSVAGSKDDRGYLVVRVDGDLHKAHRLAWLYVNGDWPEQQIDHLNGVHDDNRIANLRDVCGSLNKQNQRVAQANSASGLLGASPSGKGCRALIRVNGKQHCVGTFRSPELAHVAYRDAKRELHPGNTI